MDKVIKMYGADIYNDINPRIELGARFLGIEDYVGMCKKYNWDNPILVTIKDNKLVARPIIIDKEQDSYYCYSTDMNISSVLSDEDIEYLNKIVNQSMKSGVPLIELGDKLAIDENIVFNHAVQCIDKYAFSAFSEKKHKNVNMSITDFVKYAHENSDIKKVDTDIENMISNCKQIVNKSKGFNVFASIKPVSSKDIREIYANNGFYNISEEKISSIVKSVNDDLGTFLLDTFKNKVVIDIYKNRIRTNNYKTPISESVIRKYTHTDPIKFIDEIESKIVKEISDDVNDKDKVKNLYVANNLATQFGNECSKKLDISYTLAIAEKLNTVTKSLKEKTPIPNPTLNENEVKSFSDTPDNISKEDVQYVSNELNDTISSIIASDIEMDIVFDLTEQYHKGIPFTPLTANNLKSKYNINDKYSQQLSTEINTMVQGYIQSKENAKENSTPFVLDEFEEETVQSGKHI